MANERIADRYKMTKALADQLQAQAVELLAMVTIYDLEGCTNDDDSVKTDLQIVYLLDCVHEGGELDEHNFQPVLTAVVARVKAILLGK